jgi:hypothetical protein
MARQSAQQSASGQNTSRNTGAAIVQHQNPMNAWLRGFAEPHLACWREMLEAIADARGDTIDDLQISGLMPVADKTNPPDMQSAQLFFGLQYVPEMAKKEYAKSLGVSACESLGVDVETLEKIGQEPAVEWKEPIGQSEPNNLVFGNKP